MVLVTFGFMSLQLTLFGSFNQLKQSAIAEDGLKAHIKTHTVVDSLEFQPKVYISFKEKLKDNRRKIQDHIREIKENNDEKRRKPLALAVDRVETEKDHVQIMRATDTHKRRRKQ